MTDILLAFYGDDFTGSTDVLESLSLNDISTVLFLERPTPADLEEFDEVQAVGIAGTSRSMTPTEMDKALPPIFEALKQFDPDLVQYKVCSTFDSAPDVGSIGHAIDLAQERFDSPFVPVVVAAPSLAPRGRYVVFGNLFATAEEQTYRIDRHPSMADHPVTPMTEADLTRHLREQTNREIGNFEIRHIDGTEDAKREQILLDVLKDNEIVVFDGLNHEHQQTVGRLLWRQRPDDGLLFSASSSGLNYALTAHWKSAGIIDESDSPNPLDPTDQIVVVSGSASPVNAVQIDWALNHGFRGVRLDTAALIDSNVADTIRAETVDAALEALDAGESVLLYSARGPDDPSIEATSKQAETLDISGEQVGRRLGEQQGRILRRILEETDIERACVAGGDTSGYVTPELDIYALEFEVSVGPGSPLCRARSRTKAFDGLEIALKGGQVETRSDVPDYFGVVRDGGAATE